MKTAIIHDWLVSYGGAERVLEALLELFPGAPVYTSVCDRSKLPGILSKADIRTSFIQKLPFSKTRYRDYLPLMPLAFENFDLRGYDLVISNSHACAKGVITGPDTCHVCYCLTPMRYAWDMYHEYMQIENVGWFKRKLIPYLMSKLRTWDDLSADRVDYFAGISNFTKKRINKYYRRDAAVIFPPVETGRFTPSSETGDYYLFVSRLVPQKRADIVVKAFNDLGKKLKVVGEGRQLGDLKRLARPNVEILGRKEEPELIKLIAGCKALVFPSYEDFGIVPLEAQACGRPVIAYGRGGSLDTVIPGETGVFFNDQTPGAVVEAVNRFETMSFDSNRIRQFALTFDREVFKQKIMNFISAKVEEYHRGPAAR